MKTKIKLGIPDLKVQSFVTDINQDKQAEVKGGIPYTCNTCAAGGMCSYTYIWECSYTATEYVVCATACDCTVERYTCPGACG